MLNIKNVRMFYMRKSKNLYYLGIAEAVLERSTCLRRKYGAVIVKNDEIISTGYNGAPRGWENCDEIVYCEREALKIPHGERFELCKSVHAEMNAIISASRRDMIGSTLYLAEKNLENPEPCTMCRRLIINAGIEKVITKSQEINVVDWKE